MLNSLPGDGNFNLVCISRQQIQCSSKHEISLSEDRKHYWKKRKCLLPVYSPFFLRVVKNGNCIVKGKVCDVNVG